MNQTRSEVLDHLPGLVVCVPLERQRLAILVLRVTEMQQRHLGTVAVAGTVGIQSLSAHEAVVTTRR